MDVEFEIGSNKLLVECIAGNHILIISDLMIYELEKAPEVVRNVLKKVPVAFTEYVAINEEAKQLAESYLSEGVVSRNSTTDAQHIALATVVRADVLVSWNFKHIVNLDRIHGYNSVNIRLGYPSIEIRKPDEVVSYED